jgi:hypothetical protein
LKNPIPGVSFTVGLERKEKGINSNDTNNKADEAKRNKTATKPQQNRNKTMVYVSEGGNYT